MILLLCFQGCTWDALTFCTREICVLTFTLHSTYCIQRTCAPFHYPILTTSLNTTLLNYAFVDKFSLRSQTKGLNPHIKRSPWSRASACHERWCPRTPRWFWLQWGSVWELERRWWRWLYWWRRTPVQTVISIQLLQKLDVKMKFLFRTVKLNIKWLTVSQLWK